MSQRYPTYLHHIQKNNEEESLVAGTEPLVLHTPAFIMSVL